MTALIHAHLPEIEPAEDEIVVHMEARLFRLTAARCID
jgi:hypothetical protein